MSPGIEGAFRDAIVAAGLHPPPIVEPDGQIHRFAGDGRPGDDSAWYVMHGDGLPAGAFGDWRSGVEGKWHAKSGHQLSAAEESAHRKRLATMQHERDKQLEQRREEAATFAQRIWDECEPAADSHPYLVSKGVRAHGLRQRKSALVIPIREGVTLRSLQFVPEDGKQKRFLKRGAVAGGYLSIGKPNGVICIAEGYATAAAIHEATGHAVVAAFSAGNLEAVARAMRSKFPEAKLIVCADDDHGTTGNPGLVKALEAARAVDGLLAVPDFGADRPNGATDFNDLAQHRGREAVERALANAKAPEEATTSTQWKEAPAVDPGLRVLTLAEFLAETIPPREEILAPWLLSQSLSMIFAWRGVGKTFVALNIAYAVATGGEFLSWKATKPRRVLYLDGEMAAAALQERLKGIVLADEREFDPQYLRIVTPDLQPGPMPDLATAEGQASINEIVGDAELIIVDNISTLVRRAGRENDAESWNDVGTWALRMRQRGRSVLFLHHSGKGGAQRGSSKKEDTLDAVVCLKHPSDYSPEQGARFEVHFEKARNGGGAELKPFEATLVTDPAGKPLWTFRSVEESTFTRVLGLAVDGLSQKEIAEELEINKSNVSRHIRKAREMQMLPTKEGK